MKRSENVGLIVMGGAAFAVTFAAGMTYFAWQKPSQAAPQPVQAAAQPAQSCAQQSRSNSGANQNCQTPRSGFAYYLYPTWSSGSTTGSSSSSSEPRRQQAALTGTATSNARSGAPAASSGTVRNGFGSSAQGPFRLSAGG